MAAMVADLGFRRCDLRAHGRVLLRARLRRRGHSFVPASLRPGRAETRLTPRSSGGSRPSRRSASRPSPSTAKWTASISARPIMRESSSGATSIACSRAPGTTCPRSSRRPLPNAVLDARAMALAGGAAALVIRDARAEEFEAIGRMLVAVYSGLEGFPKPESQPDYYRRLAQIGDRPASRRRGWWSRKKTGGSPARWCTMPTWRRTARAGQRAARARRCRLPFPRSRPGSSRPRDRHGADRTLRRACEGGAPPPARHPLDRRDEGRARNLYGARI